MDANASLHWTQVPAGVMRAFFIAVLTAFLIGAAGGYVVRGTSASTPTGAQTTHRPFVTEPIPYSSPTQSPTSPPTLDPRGFTVPI